MAKTQWNSIFKRNWSAIEVKAINISRSPNFVRLNFVRPIQILLRTKINFRSYQNSFMEMKFVLDGQKSFSRWIKFFRENVFRPLRTKIIFSLGKVEWILTAANKNHFQWRTNFISWKCVLLVAERFRFNWIRNSYNGMNFVRPRNKIFIS